MTATPAEGPSAADLLRWAETLSGIARTGLGFTQSLYEQERFEEVLRIAADIRAAAIEEAEADALFESWVMAVGSGVPGYVTPKVAVAAIVGNERGELLLTQRADSGWWLYPVGWADVGYSPSEVAIKEVYEETGIEVEPVAAGSGVVIRRLQAEKANPLGDIIWGVSRSLLQTNKALFLPYASKNKDAIPAEYREVIRRALLKDPEKRFANVEEMVRAAGWSSVGAHTTPIISSPASPVAAWTTPRRVSVASTRL